MHPGQRLRKDREWPSRSNGRRLNARGRRAGIFTDAGRSALDRGGARWATRSKRSATCRCRRTSSARMHPGSRSLSDGLCARARIDRGAYRRTPLHAGDARGAGARVSSAPSITLHVGYGTFQPIRDEQVEDHQMESEHSKSITRTAATISAAKREGRRSSPSARRRPARSNRCRSHRTGPCQRARRRCADGNDAPAFSLRRESAAAAASLTTNRSESIS